MKLPIINEDQRAALIALVDRDAFRRGVLHLRLKGMGHKSLDFYSINDFLEVALSDIKFQGAVIVLNGGENENYEVERILALLDLPLLLVTLEERFDALNRLNESFLKSRFFDAVPLSCGDRDLEWRLKFLFNRHELTLSKAKRLEWGVYRFEEISRSVFFKDTVVKLRPKEFDLALTFFRNCEVTLTREKLCAVLWGGGLKDVGSRTLDVHVCKIRKKLEITPCNGFSLQSIFGAEYRLTVMASQKLAAKMVN
ncbi:DNA-binding response OmpR family regulator [Variovorax boronicumulans]|uniref:winged helix-turn-helix domain-containing protein n=1 Tax=Variovorax boronicumulans TaxID=436515 RepID=UPI00278A6920|nr:winged helix-turn-helix domain-containing protein [Variovorax boronicumulans]MDQ0015380.1 DNA-binding response OmpR family regulator [Variovorax boronicumulans]